MTRIANDEVVILKGAAGIETEKAIRFTFREVNDALLPDPKTEWFPLSQVKSITRNPGGEDELVIKQWIAQQKGLV